ncbi:MAG: YrrS family protein [Paenisporosarcina sp.]
MAEIQRRYSSKNHRPNKPDRTNKILNALIGLVIFLIVITAGFIFLGDDESANTSNKEETNEGSDSQTNDDSDGTEGLTSEEIEEPTEEVTEESTEVAEESTDETSTPGGKVTSTPSDDPLVSESVVNADWKPIGTSQTGEHASVYEKGHIDWNEKIKAISYTTGLAEDNMIVWRIANGGSPQKSIAVVSSNDKKENYRVSLIWVDGEGWKPEKMETLKTLEGAY